MESSPRPPPPPASWLVAAAAILVGAGFIGWHAQFGALEAIHRLFGDAALDMAASAISILATREMSPVPGFLTALIAATAVFYAGRPRTGIALMGVMIVIAVLAPLLRWLRLTGTTPPGVVIGRRFDALWPIYVDYPRFDSALFILLREGVPMLVFAAAVLLVTCRWRVALALCALFAGTWLVVSRFGYRLIEMGSTGYLEHHAPYWAAFNAGVAAILFYWAAGARGTPPHLCKGCRYDLRGIGPASPCPECGRER